MGGRPASFMYTRQGGGPAWSRANQANVLPSIAVEPPPTGMPTLIPVPTPNPPCPPKLPPPTPIPTPTGGPDGTNGGLSIDRARTSVPLAVRIMTSSSRRPSVSISTLRRSTTSW
ncbi:MAG: hypothetical protein EHM88_12585 [Candidatus Rokuibacteriota bacterium]|nr:MAG: hypothetical protein EHM88_12585 [Candidatus Rokubacteria bacterium]